jgi:hypothetical protein
MFGPSAGNIATAYIAEQTRLEGTRLRNAQAWQEFRRNNPTATLEEMSTFADNISGGDSWLRGQFPAGEVLSNIAQQNEARRAQEEVGRASAAAQAQTTLNDNIERAYARNLFSAPNDVDAMEGTLQQFGGSNPQNRSLVQRTIAGLGNPESVRQRFVSQSIAQYGPAAVEAFRGGGEAAVNSQFSNLPDPIRQGLINNARGVITREDEDRALRRDQAYATIDNQRAGAEASRANTVLQGTQNRVALATLNTGLVNAVQADPSIGAAIGEGDQATASGLIRQRLLANGQQPNDANVAELYSLAETSRGVRLMQEHKARVDAARTQAARLEDRELIAENRNLIKATVAPYTAAIRNETWRNQVDGAMQATAATLYMTPAQAQAAIRVIADMPNTTKPEDLVVAAQQAAIREGAQPLRAGTQAIRDFYVRNSVGEAPMRAPAYVYSATTALDQSAANFNAAITTARSQPNGQAQFDRELQAYRNYLQAERAALNARFATRGTWSTTTFTEAQRDAVANRIAELEASLETIASQPFQPNRGGTVPGPRNNQDPRNVISNTPPRGAPREGSESRPFERQLSEVQNDITERYQRGEISGAEATALRVVATDSRLSTNMAPPPAALMPGGSAAATLAGGPASYTPEPHSNGTSFLPNGAVMPGGARMAASKVRSIANNINPDTNQRIGPDVAIDLAARMYGVTREQVIAALQGRAPRQ